MLYPAELQRHFLLPPCQGMRSYYNGFPAKMQAVVIQSACAAKTKMECPAPAAGFSLVIKACPTYFPGVSAPLARGLLLCLMHTFPLRSPPAAGVSRLPKEHSNGIPLFFTFFDFFSKKCLHFAFLFAIIIRHPAARGTKMNMGAFPSGQWGQTVNLLLNASVVRIHQLPPKTTSFGLSFLFSPVIPTAQ